MSFTETCIPQSKARQCFAFQRSFTIAVIIELSTFCLQLKQRLQLFTQVWLYNIDSAAQRYYIIGFRPQANSPRKHWGPTQLQKLSLCQMSSPRSEFMKNIVINVRWNKQFYRLSWVQRCKEINNNDIFLRNQISKQWKKLNTKTNPRQQAEKYKIKNFK